ncbi:hypothetical protein QR680_009518 [Steinernema hermaphroditum]|uniref:TPPC8 first Ig-like domain-containing protein n=1 Tax=Steinernema hermaphroditum TaxID=289476 RepID=A0AA39IN14_9BILA|nr:hypothetical protein QR680_009518 [Steinernema hermaphroditum]
MEVAPSSSSGGRQSGNAPSPSARVGSVVRSRIDLWTDCCARLRSAQKMNEAVQNGFAPLVALLTSEGVDSICAKNRLTFADLLCPFATVSATVKDPNLQAVKAKIRLEVRDIQRHGFLLTLTALPHVLKEAVGAAAAKGSDAWAQAYQDSLFAWFESAGHEFLRTYLCSMFVISVHEANPLGELARLVQLQYVQQHGSGDNAPSLGPRHCTDPNWFAPNILKYYVLLYDISVGGEDDSAARLIFDSMCKTYGEKNCHFLKINSGQVGMSLPDPWAFALETRYRGLQAGLTAARKSLLLAKNDSIESPTSPLSVSSHHSSEPRLLATPISTVSSAVRAHSPIFATSGHGLSIPALSSSTLENGTGSMGTAQPLPSPIVEATSPASHFEFGGAHGQLLNTEDRQRITALVESFVNDALVPFAEKQMRALSENLNGRRGFSKSIFSGMRKWVGSSSTGQLGATPMSYSSESSEMQLRRLADLAFLFGLYSYAYPIYHSLRKDFATDQAWLYQAGASEMAAICKFLSEETVTYKDFPHRYITDAMDCYMTSCGQSLLAVRCALLANVMFQELATKENGSDQSRVIYKEASNFLIRMTSVHSDLESAVLLERASDCFAKGELPRKMAFHYILAGHRFMKAGLDDICLKCYQKALPQVVERQWHFAEDQILYKLATDSKNMALSKQCAISLVKPYSKQHPDQQGTFLKKMLQVLQNFSSEAMREPFPVPLLDTSEIVTIYGERPNWTEDCVDTHDWGDLQMSACQFLKLHPMASRRSVQTKTTDNRKRAVTPAFENFRIQIPLKNPLDVPLTLRNLQLVTSEVISRSGDQCESEVEAHTIDVLVIGPQKEAIAELSLKPTAAVSRMKISKLKFQLVCDDISVTGFIPLNVRGPRKSALQDFTYEDDCRLDVDVAEERWPLLDVKLSYRSLDYCDQMFTCNVSVTNIGKVDVNSFSLVTDRPDLAILLDTRSTLVAQSRIGAGDSVPFLSQMHSLALTPGNSLQLKLMLRAPPQPVDFYPVRLLFVYTGSNGTFREHRECIKFTTRPILKTTARLLDAYSGVCCVDFQNLTTPRDKMIAKIEMQRISVVSRPADSRFSTQKSFAYICPIRNRSILLESDQHDSYCFTLSGSVASPAMESTELWLADQSSLSPLPAWPGYSFQVAKPTKSQLQMSSSQLAYLELAIFWKAQLVFSDGTLSTLTIFGETPVQNPFVASDRSAHHSHRIPGTDPALEIVAAHIETDEFSVEKSVPISLGEASKNVISSLHVSSPIITHNFVENRFCSFATRLTVHNLNQTLRDVWVTVNCGPIDSPVSATESGVSSILQAVAVATASSHQALVPQQSVFRAKVPHGSSHSFDIRLRATSPSVYDLSCSIRASVSFDAASSAERVPLHVLPSYVTILDSRASHGVRAAAALRV